MSSDLLLNPARIRCARETAGLSKVQLAQLLSVDPRTITNYEKDGAPQTKINALSEILKVMPSFFTVHPSDPAIGDLSETQVWFRSMRKSTARQRKSAVGHGKSALLLFHWIENHFNLPCNDLPMEDIAQMPPRSSALALRGDWGYGRIPFLIWSVWLNRMAFVFLACLQWVRKLMRLVLYLLGSRI